MLRTLPMPKLTKECEIEKFRAVLDLRTVCQQHDGKVYSMAEKEEGVNSSMCRSSCLERKPFRAKRERDPETGKNVLIPAAFPTQSWKAWVSDGSPNIDIWMKQKE